MNGIEVLVVPYSKALTKEQFKDSQLENFNPFIELLNKVLDELHLNHQKTVP